MSMASVRLVEIHSLVEGSAAILNGCHGVVCDNPRGEEGRVPVLVPSRRRRVLARMANLRDLGASDEDVLELLLQSLAEDELLLAFANPMDQDNEALFFDMEGENVLNAGKLPPLSSLICSRQAHAAESSSAFVDGETVFQAMKYTVRAAGACSLQLTTWLSELEDPGGARVFEEAQRRGHTTVDARPLSAFLAHLDAFVGAPACESAIFITSSLDGLVLPCDATAPAEPRQPPATHSLALLRCGGSFRLVHSLVDALPFCTAVSGSHWLAPAEARAVLHSAATLGTTDCATEACAAAEALGFICEATKDFPRRERLLVCATPATPVSPGRLATALVELVAALFEAFSSKT